VVALSLVAAAVQVVNNAATYSPASLGPNTLEIAGFATVFYQLILKPVLSVLGVAKQVNAIETQAAADAAAPVKKEEVPPFLQDSTTTVGDYLEAEQKQTPKVFPF
jgi:hypothetical protein